MAEFEAFVPNVEVNGQAVLSVVAGMLAKELAVKILAENGISNIKPESWYPQQQWLNAFKKIYDKIGHLAINAIGKKIPENAAWPSHVASVESALASIDTAYHLNHRINGIVMFDPASGKMLDGIGHYQFKKVSEHEARIICETPYPCDFDKGICWAVADKFKPVGSKVFVLEDEVIGCKKGGAKSCTYIVKW